MPLRFGVKWIPEPLIDPQLRLSADERQSVRLAAWSRWMRDPTHLVMYSGGLGAAIVGFLFLPDFIEPLLGGHQSYFTLIWFVLYMAAVSGVIMVMRRIGYAPCLYAELRRRGHNVCARCGYLLTGLPDESIKCPECGTPNKRVA